MGTKKLGFRLKEKNVNYNNQINKKLYEKLRVIKKSKATHEL